MLGGAKLCLLSALGSRLYYLQFSEADRYQTLSEDNRVRLYPVLPRRGKFLDRNGVIVAEGTPRYRLLLDPSVRPPASITSRILRGNKTTDTSIQEETIANLSHLIDLPVERQEELIKQLADLPNNEQLLIEDFLDWDKVAKIEVNIPDLPGVNIESLEVRHYLHSETMSHITGYLSEPSEEDLKEGNIIRHPEFRVGKTGLERALEDSLRGKAGVRQVEVNARGSHVRELDTNEGVPGEDARLTIDIELQQFVHAQLIGKGGLQTEGGSSVVLDIKTGDVLAMVSVPGYDSNKFVRKIEPEYWNYLNKDPDLPFINKAVAAEYPPGSTFKTIVALAALQNGIINADTTVFCPGFYTFGDRNFHCWYRDGHGELDLKRAIAQSCNVYFYHTAKLLGVDKIAETARKLGFDEPLGIELPGEKAGVIPDTRWKPAVIGEPWYQGETLNTGIGQGYVLSTPLQLAVAAARMASGGRAVVPRLVIREPEKELVSIDGGRKILVPREREEFPQIEGISQEHLQTVLDGMDMVVNHWRGLVYRNRVTVEGREFAGKTGTAQVLSHKTFKYIPTERQERYHALFIGFAPVHAPRYAVSVVIEHGGYGSQIAAPIGGKILYETQRLMSGVG